MAMGDDELLRALAHKKPEEALPHELRATPAEGMIFKILRLLAREIVALKDRPPRP